VRGLKEVKEVNEVNEVKEKNGGVAAFFDLDGTLVALPSLERRFFQTLRYRREIPARNYFLWLKEAIRLLPHGISVILQGNKMHLRGMKVFDESGEGDGDVSTWHKSGRPAQFPSKLGVDGANQAEGQATQAPPPRIRRSPVPFFAKAVERIAWHARQGHEIVLMSGTLEPLACGAARALEGELAVRGVRAKIIVCATRLEEVDGRWTGKILGEAMFGEAKARAAQQMAAEMRLDLNRCFAYGDSAQDRWLLSIVGKATTVNPSPELRAIAVRQGWTTETWDGRKDSTQRAQRTQSSLRTPGTERMLDSLRIAKRLPLPKGSSGAHG